MTLVLAIESATDAAGVALADGDGLLAEVRVGRGRRHAETIAPGVATVCRLAGVALPDVDAVAVDVGPGLFTGLRVGIATAKGIAFGLGLPVVPVTSLDVLAAAVAAGRPAAGSDRTVVAVVDARRGEVFWARYRIARDRSELPAGGADGPGFPAGAGGLAVPARLSEPRASAPDVLAAELASLAATEVEPPLVVGDGALRYPGVLAGSGAVPVHAVLAHPRVDVLAAVGVRRAADGLAVDPAGVDALYVREADARINWERRRPPRPVDGGPAAGTASVGGAETGQPAP